jgi:drug/metabolite transporter (DMT)-like permease
MTMAAYRTFASLITLALGAGIAWVVYGILSKSLRELLNQVIRIPAGTTFYLRSLALIVAFISLSKFVISPSDTQTHFMDYVWLVATAIGEAFENLAYVVLVYLVLITVVVVVLKPKNER